MTALTSQILQSHGSANLLFKGHTLTQSRDPSICQTCIYHLYLYQGTVDRLNSSEDWSSTRALVKVYSTRKMSLMCVSYDRGVSGTSTSVKRVNLVWLGGGQCCVLISMLPWVHLNVGYYLHWLSTQIFRCHGCSKSNALWCTYRKSRSPWLVPRKKTIFWLWTVNSLRLAAIKKLKRYLKTTKLLH